MPAGKKRSGTKAKVVRSSPKPARRSSAPESASAPKKAAPKRNRNSSSVKLPSVLFEPDPIVAPPESVVALPAPAPALVESDPAPSLAPAPGAPDQELGVPGPTVGSDPIAIPGSPDGVSRGEPASEPIPEPAPLRLPDPVAMPGAEHVQGPLEVPAPEPKAWLVVRDPHSLYATWELGAAEVRRRINESTDARLWLRLIRPGLAGLAILESPVNPEASGVFLERPPQVEGSVAVELGTFPLASLSWLPMAQSAGVELPSVRPVPSAPPPVSAEPLAEAAAEAACRSLAPESPASPSEAPPEGLVPAPGTAPTEASGSPGSQTPGEAATPEPLPLEVGVASLSSLSVAAVPRPGAPITPGESAPTEGASPSSADLQAASVGGDRGRSFWLNVNAELVVYGATEPGAVLRISGDPVALRPDGTFSCRFALPDGLHFLSVVADSPDGVETRGVELRFERATRRQGEVHAAPVNPVLRPPTG